jgi:LPXTG-motif cell wall-anchored protein
MLPPFEKHHPARAEATKDTDRNSPNLGGGWVVGNTFVIEGPAPHGSGEDNNGKSKWERQYRYQATAERQTSTGFVYEWFVANPGAPWVSTGETRSTLPGPDDVQVVLYKDGAWTTDTPGEPWVQIDKQTSYKNGVQIPCDKKPDPKVETTSSSTCAPPGSTAATVTTTTTTTDWVLVDSKWVSGTPKVETSTSYRPLTPEEANDPKCAPAPKVTTTEWQDGRFACGDTTVTQTRTVTTTPYKWEPSEIEEDDSQVEALSLIDVKPVYGRWVLDTANAKKVTETRTRNLKPEEIVPCPTDPTTTTTPPPTVPGTTTPPPTVPTTTAVEVESQPPAAAPTTTTQPPSAAAPAAGLPSTGSSSLTMALIALVVLLGGTALVRLGRRSTD